MTRIILDQELREKLHNLDEPLELCDEEGTVLAHLLPISKPAQDVPGTPPQLSEEELQCRRQERTYSTAEVIAHLEQL